MIRCVTLDDAAPIIEIYNKYILDSDISFETEPLSVETMRQRIAAIAGEYPYFVYEDEQGIAGYCYAHAWKERAAYCHTWETTVYLAAGREGRGIGWRLMQHLIEACRSAGCHALVACITAGNERSCALHRRLGFEQVSAFPEVGHKHGKWLGVVDYELLL